MCETALCLKSSRTGRAFGGLGGNASAGATVTVGGAYFPDTSAPLSFTSGGSVSAGVFAEEDEDVLYAGSVLRRSRGERHFGYAVGVVEGRNQPLLSLLLHYKCLNTLSGLAGSTV